MPSPSARENDQTVLGDLLVALPDLRQQHSPDSKTYGLLQRVARREVERAFRGEAAEPQDFGPYGPLLFPYYRMGAADSLNLFDLDELILFSFYWCNRFRYHRALDIGANLGLHSILLSKCGFAVRAFEPEPHHFDILKKNLVLNGCLGVDPLKAAVSCRNGQMEFVRVLGNTTGSHLAGAKDNPYGDLERFPVDVVSVTDITDAVDLIKLDAEAHEKDILLSVPVTTWKTVDAVVEVGTRSNAEAIFGHFQGTKVRLFAQKCGWEQARTVEDMPFSYRDGTLFISSKNEMPWG